MDILKHDLSERVLTGRKSGELSSGSATSTYLKVAAEPSGLHFPYHCDKKIAYRMQNVFKGINKCCLKKKGGRLKVSMVSYILDTLH